MSERAADAVFQVPPVEWVAKRLSGLQKLLERETAPSALLLRRVLGPVRLVPCKPEVGRTYYRAETALQVLELLEDPDGGSNSLRQWSAMEADKGDAAKGHDLLQVADTHQARADAMRAGRGATPAAAGPAPGAPPSDVQRASVIR